MGSSGGSSDSKPAGQGPPPPAGSILPQGTSAPHNPSWINFLGDTNTPSRGLTPEMLEAIMASARPPPPGAPPAAAAALPPPPSKPRDQLAQLFSGRGEGGGGGRGAGSGGNGGGWGGH